MVNAQEWLDREYPKEKRSEAREIYLNEPSLEGELDLGDFTYCYYGYYNNDFSEHGVEVYIFLSLDENKLTFKNKPKEAKIIKLVDAQKWLDKWYPKEGGCLRENKNHNNLNKKRNEIENLCINKQNLEGSLDLFDFSSLKWLDCSNNKLTNLNLSNCLQLGEIVCSYNNFSNLKFLTILFNPENLKDLYIRGNNLSSDLTWLISLVNLKALDLSNNNFYGSLEPLQKLTKLRGLDISNTNLNSGIEYLPESLDYIKYSTKDKPDCKVSQIKEQLDSKYWRDIHEWFQPKCKKAWIELFIFNKEQTKQLFQEWNKDVELITPEDAKFLNWYLNTIKLDLDWALKNEEEFKDWRDNYFYFGTCEECQQTNTSGVKYSKRKGWCKSCNAKHFKAEFNNWTSGNLQIDKFIQQCQLEATSTWNVLEWIPYEKFTNIEFIANGGFGKVEKAEWTGGVIREWNNEEKKWERHGDYENYEWKNYKTVALKILFNSQNLNQDFLKELTLYKMFKSSVSNMVPCYGISRDLEGNYIMVMKYMKEGNLRDYLKKNYRGLKFYDKYYGKNKLHFLKQIITGLKNVHAKELVHKDFHSGNIIVDNGIIRTECRITDLGLCQPVDFDKGNKIDSSKVFGVLPYVAPEVLRGKPYTQASDIYSLGMVMYEIITGLPPYIDQVHDINLSLQICRGIRPEFPKEFKYHQILVDLITICWDSKPENRPTAREISSVVEEWFEEESGNKGELKEHTLFYQQYKEAEEHNWTLPYKIKYPTYQLPEGVVMHSKPINTKEINKKLETMEYSEELAFDFGKLKLEENNSDWTNINPNFTDELISFWQNHNFTYPQTQEWINIGINPTDYNFATWLRDEIKISPTELLNDSSRLEDLKEQFNEQLQTQIEQPPKS